MREKNNVIERREKIKDFLASQGMIRGHAGAAPARGDPLRDPPPVLDLSWQGDENDSGATATMKGSNANAKRGKNGNPRSSSGILSRSETASAGSSGTPTPPGSRSPVMATLDNVGPGTGYHGANGSGGALNHPSVQQNGGYAMVNGGYGAGGGGAGTRLPPSSALLNGTYNSAIGGNVGSQLPPMHHQPRDSRDGYGPSPYQSHPQQLGHLLSSPHPSPYNHSQRSPYHDGPLAPPATYPPPHSHLHPHPQEPPPAQYASHTQTHYSNGRRHPQSLDEIPSYPGGPKFMEGTGLTRGASGSVATMQMTHHHHIPPPPLPRAPSPHVPTTTATTTYSPQSQTSPQQTQTQTQTQQAGTSSGSSSWLGSSMQQEPSQRPQLPNLSTQPSSLGWNASSSYTPSTGYPASGYSQTPSSASLHSSTSVNVEQSGMPPLTSPDSIHTTPILDAPPSVPVVGISPILSIPQVNLNPYVPGKESTFGPLYNGFKLEEDPDSPQQQQQQQQQQRYASYQAMMNPDAVAEIMTPGVMASTSGSGYDMSMVAYAPMAAAVVPLVAGGGFDPSAMAYTFGPMHHIPEFTESNYVYHYMNTVLASQYLLADQTAIKQFIYNQVISSSSAHSAVCLLAAVHKHCMDMIDQRNSLGVVSNWSVNTSKIDVFYNQTIRALGYVTRDEPEGSKRRVQATSEADAMACLHVVSSFLFSGGHGKWDEFLRGACDWVEGVFKSSAQGPLDALLRSNESTSFIIRTASWFDVWSAITELRDPRFLDIYRALFSPRSGSATHSTLSNMDMLNVMGCSNENFLAMAEIAALAAWKDRSQRDGCLSIPKLVERGRHIESVYLQPTAFVEEVPTNASQTPIADDIESRRRLAANVFRASAKVYLHSVLSGCYPHIPEIREGVSETIACLRAIPSSYTDASRVVVRSVVLSIYICGCLTDDFDQRQYLTSQLDALGQEEVLGNCGEAKRIMESVWSNRKQSEEVPWREAMREVPGGQGNLLLA